MIETNINVIHRNLAMRLPNVQNLFLLALISTMFIPYVVSFMRLGESSVFNAEIVALLFWYATSLTIPLVIKELDTTLILWFLTFILVGIPIGCDIVYHMTSINPGQWYHQYTGAINSHAYYLFMETWALIITPGFAFFVAVLFIQKMSRKLKENG